MKTKIVEISVDNILIEGESGWVVGSYPSAVRITRMYHSHPPGKRTRVYPCTSPASRDRVKRMISLAQQIWQ